MFLVELDNLNAENNLKLTVTLLMMNKLVEVAQGIIRFKLKYSMHHVRSDGNVCEPLSKVWCCQWRVNEKKNDEMVSGITAFFRLGSLWPIELGGMVLFECDFVGLHSPHTSPTWDWNVCRNLIVYERCLKAGNVINCMLM